MDKVHQALLERARKALDEAETQRTRATELLAFVQALERTEPSGIVRCAWCGRVAADGHWIDPYRFLRSGLREQLSRNASHGVCPTCLEGELERTERHYMDRRQSQPAAPEDQGPA